MILLKDLGMKLPNENSKQKRRFGLYQCPECETTMEMLVYSVESRGTKMCKSCSTTKNKTTHGGRYHRLYGTWSDQRDRCNRESHKYYDRYGGRGIKMASEFDDFSVWLLYVESLENAYKDNYTIDRVDNDKGYEKGNLRWASKSVQAHNTRRLRTTNKTGFRGVITTKSGKFSASLGINSKKLYLGTFNSATEAALAYDSYVYKNRLEHTTNGLLDDELKKQLDIQTLLETPTKENVPKVLSLQGYEELAKEVASVPVSNEALELDILCKQKEALNA